MSAEATVKAQARRTLKNNWATAICAMLIAIIPVCMNDAATSTLSLLFISLIKDNNLAEIVIYIVGIPVELIMGFLFSPALNGFIRTYYRAAKTGRMDISDVFYYFKKGQYGKTLKLNIRLLLRLIIPYFLIFSPLYAFQILSNTLWKDIDINQVLYNNVSFILTVLSSLAMILYTIRYFAIYAVSIDIEPDDTGDDFRINKQIMRGRTGICAKLIFSFTPWILLCLTVLPMLYVIPYITESLCISVKWIKEAALAYRD